jgi:hypothetical protein
MFAIAYQLPSYHRQIAQEGKGMAAKSVALKQSTRHELVTKAIFEALLKLDKVQDLEIKHNFRIQGQSGRYRVDVYYKFRAGPVTHHAIVEVKKRGRSVEQGELLKLHTVITDVPGQPRGIFVSQVGYQSGAKEFALAKGIDTFIIREVKRDEHRIQLGSLSIGFVPLVKNMTATELTILTPTVSDPRMTLDRAWAEKSPGLRMVNIAGGMGTAQFVDAAGEVRTTMQKLIQDRVRLLGKAGRTQLDEKFPNPTFMTASEITDADGKPVKNVKVEGVTATLDVSKTTTLHPIFRKDTATYLFTKAMESDQRYALVVEPESGFEAHVSPAAPSRM